MSKHKSISHTVYPPNHNPAVMSDPKKFTAAFNKWAIWVRRQQK